MEDVCDKKDCPLYNCYLNPENYPPLKQKLANYEKEIEKTPIKYSKETRENVYNWMEQSAIKIRMACLACQHFNKMDMYSLLLTEEAKNVLISK